MSHTRLKTGQTQFKIKTVSSLAVVHPSNPGRGGLHNIRQAGS